MTPATDAPAAPASSAGPVPAPAAPGTAPDRGGPAPAPSRDPVPASVPRPSRVAVIVGSNREGRFGPVVADWLLGHLGDRADLVADVVDTADTRLPTALSHSPSPEVAAELAKVTPKLADAEAFVVLTPEYNHSFPAALKALVDWHYAEWRAKPVAFVSYGGVSGGLRAVEQLRQVFAELHAVTVRDSVSFHNAGASFDELGRHRDPAAADAAAKVMLDRLVWWALALRDAKSVRPYEG
ncbi:NADPH-dependent FMN reductase [Streptomyces fructofermentans]|uniref:FMN reductase n=1 Tax=Streptomyces fructofermentans TaxID=152141 RepID=A0A918NA55_9ACTN|nr:NAD(P)H-dependent oxidoreductase [Streptomyces fructofermentans]GGX55639.1 FMN reductase [Streptomyces fructofermentans]